MKLFFYLFLLTVNLSVFSQTSLNVKPALDTSVLGKWPSVSNGALSNNGKYVSYLVKEYIPEEKTTTVVLAPESKWKKELLGVTDAKFTGDCKWLVFTSNDSLQQLKLGGSQILSIPQVQSFQLAPHPKGEWLVYQLKTTGKELVIRDVPTGKEQKFPSVDRYVLSPDGGIVLLQTTSENKKETRLNWIDLIGGKQTVIWSGTGSRLQQFVFDEVGAHLAFTTEEKGKGSLWHYSKSIDKATMLASDGDTSLNGLLIGGIERFTKDGTRLFFNLEKRQSTAPKSSSFVNVNIWSTRDLMLQSEKLNELKNSNSIVKKYFSVLNTTNGGVIQLQNEFEELAHSRTDDYCLVRWFNTDQDLIGNDAQWSSAFKESVLYLVSVKDGTRKELPWRHKLNILSDFSPAGKFIIYWERPELNYFAYEIATGLTRNITERIDEDITSNLCYINPPLEKKPLIPEAGWLKDDAGVLIYDRNDIWLVDPLEKKQPENITNGYGRKHDIIFRLGLDEYRNNRFLAGQRLILTAFNKHTKQNGHYTKMLGQKGDPTLINFESVLYCVSLDNGTNGGDMKPRFPIKAQNGSAHLVIRETTSSFPNFYYTKDLKKFLQVSYLQPDKKFNWMTSELQTWVAPDGDTLQGVLYKPENFDSSKKYPILFSYYEQFSDQFNQYWIPNLSMARINIPWFVSNGYLVFTPDIHYRLPKVRESVLNCVVSAANHLSKLPFVDSTKMGIQGHSFGGFETGHLVTGTDIFAAASTACGYYDLISDAGTLLFWGFPRTGVSERYMRGNIWEKQDEYVENSSIFYLDRVKTPLLIMTGEKDGQVPHDQSIELFLGLRRLQKTAWMLSYGDAGHVLFKNDATDFTIRLTQFFDHFLKAKPAPGWMIQGIPAKQKGKETGYKLYHNW